MTQLSLLRPISGGATVLTSALPGKAYLRKRLRCHDCGRALVLERLVPLSPAGVRGYYKCLGRDRHLHSLDRDGVAATVVCDSGDRLWFN